MEIVETKLCTSMRSSPVHSTMTLKSKPCFCKKVLCWSALLLSLHKKILFALLCTFFILLGFLKSRLFFNDHHKKKRTFNLKKKKNQIFFISKFYWLNKGTSRESLWKRNFNGVFDCNAAVYSWWWILFTTAKYIQYILNTNK